MNVGAKSKRNVYISVAIFLLSAAGYMANWRFGYASGDTVPNSLLPFSILGQRTFYLDRFFSAHTNLPYYVIATHGHVASIYPIGASLTALPVYAAYMLVGGKVSMAAGAAVGRVAAVVITALTASLLYVLMTRLGFDWKWSMLGTVLFGVGSEAMSISSQGLWQHGPADLWLVIMLLCAVAILRNQSLLSGGVAGFAIGMVVLTRPEDAILVVPFSVWLFEKQLRKPVVVALGVALVIIAADMAYNTQVFGSPLSTGYGSTQRLFGFPLLMGLMGNLFSPSKGLLVYMPWSIFVLYWIRHMFTKDFYVKRPYGPMFLAIIPYLILYSKFFQWPAGYCFGPRYMTDVAPYLSILAVAALSQVTMRFRLVWRILALTSVCWSVGIQLLGTYAPLTAGAWNVAARPNTFYAPLWNLRGSQIAFYINDVKAEFFPPVPIKDPKVKFLSLSLVQKPYIYEPGVVVSKYSPDTTYHGYAILTNTGKNGWSAYPNYSGKYAVHFCYTVWKGNKEVVSNGVRSALLHAVQPGKTVKVYFQFNTPFQPGTYTYVFTLVQENVEWFQAGKKPSNAYEKTVVVQ